VTTVPVRLDRLRWSHLEQVLAIEADLFGAEQWTEGMFSSELESADRWYRVAIEGSADAGAVLGYAGLWVAADEAWVQNLAVRRDAQGRGIGGRLIDDLLGEALRRGRHRVALEVAADNIIAQRLYVTRGFEVVGMRRGYYQPSGADALVMIRDQP